MDKSTIEEAHQDLVARLVKPPEHIIATISPEAMDCLHAAVGIAGEAGELLDAVKKTAVYEKPLDRKNVIEELGDLEFYMEQLRSRLGISRGDTLWANYEKLNRRYPLGYTNEAAHARADKA